MFLAVLHAVCSSFKNEPKFCLVLSFIIRINLNSTYFSLIYFHVFVACLAWQMIISKFLLNFGLTQFDAHFFIMTFLSFRVFVAGRLWYMIVY